VIDVIRRDVTLSACRFPLAAYLVLITVGAQPLRAPNASSHRRAVRQRCGSEARVRRALTFTVSFRASETSEKSPQVVSAVAIGRPHECPGGPFALSRLQRSSLRVTRERLAAAIATSVFNSRRRLAVTVARRGRYPRLRDWRRFGSRTVSHARAGPRLPSEPEIACIPSKNTTYLRHRDQMSSGTVQHIGKLIVMRQHAAQTSRVPTRAVMHDSRR
jgi:hypothetical protein